jgi:hypothetical protein
LSPRRISLAGLVAIALAAAPAAASAAPAITFDHACYQDNGSSSKARFRADGLAAQSVLPVALDGQVIGQVAADEHGSLVASFPVPPHGASDEVESTHELTLTPATGDVLRTTFLTTSVAADFAPSRGDPRTMKVRFTASGMNLVTRSSKVYAHYVAPNGRSRMTVALGRATGVCGQLRSPLRRLFPFRPAAGQWTLQIDTKRAYRKGGASTTYPWARIGVRVPVAE